MIKFANLSDIDLNPQILPPVLTPFATKYLLTQGVAYHPAVDPSSIDQLLSNNDNQQLDIDQFANIEQIIEELSKPENNAQHQIFKNEQANVYCEVWQDTRWGYPLKWDDNISFIATPIIITTDRNTNVVIAETLLCSPNASTVIQLNIAPNQTVFTITAWRKENDLPCQIKQEQQIITYDPRSKTVQTSHNDGISKSMLRHLDTVWSASPEAVENLLTNHPIWQFAYSSLARFCQNWEKLPVDHQNMPALQFTESDYIWALQKQWIAKTTIMAENHAENLVQIPTLQAQIQATQNHTPWYQTFYNSWNGPIQAIHYLKTLDKIQQLLPIQPEKALKLYQDNYLSISEIKATIHLTQPEFKPQHNTWQSHAILATENFLQSALELELEQLDIASRNNLEMIPDPSQTLIQNITATIFNTYHVIDAIFIDELTQTDANPKANLVLLEPQKNLEKNEKDKDLSPIDWDVKNWIICEQLANWHPSRITDPIFLQNYQNDENNQIKHWLNKQKIRQAPAYLGIAFYMQNLEQLDGLTWNNFRQTNYILQRIYDRYQLLPQLPPSLADSNPKKQLHMIAVYLNHLAKELNLSPSHTPAPQNWLTESMKQLKIAQTIGEPLDPELSVAKAQRKALIKTAKSLQL